MGVMHELGIRFLDGNGMELEGVGENLINVHTIDTEGLHPLIDEVNITVMCDVTNPLLGENGATFVFGPQKGAALEKGMTHFADVVEKQMHEKFRDYPGTGAAGGLRFALKTFLNAKLQSGIKTIMDINNFEKLLNGVDLVVTGEGKLDSQSVQGKVISGIGEACRKSRIPVIAIVGGMGKMEK